MTDQRVMPNRPDLILTVENSKQAFLIDVAMSNNKLRDKPHEKIIKYRDLKIQL